MRISDWSSDVCSSDLLARSLRGVFEPLLRAETRVWAEPLVVQRFADYRAERPEGLTAWVPLKMTPGTGRALAVLDAGFVLEMLDRFFGGPGVAPGAIPNEFSATAEMMAARVVRHRAAPLTISSEPPGRPGFRERGRAA